MKKILLTMTATMLLCAACAKSEVKGDSNGDIPLDSSESVNKEDELVGNEIDGLGEEHNELMYVDSPEGLMVRANPSITAGKIYLLKDNQEVRVIETDPAIATIDGIEGHWALIETDEITGYVFNGYLAGEAAINPEYNIVYNEAGTIESFILPDGRIINRNSLTHEGYPYKIDSIKLYYTQTIESAYKKIVNTFVILYKNDSNDEWLYLVTNDLKNYGFIRVEDISENSFYGNLTNNMNSGNFYTKRLNQEYSVRKTHENIERYGPLLMIKLDTKIVKIWDAFSVRGWNSVKDHLLIDIFENNDLLLYVQRYEGGFYVIYNMDKEDQVAIFNEVPLFNENKSAFVSYGSFYSEAPTFELYSINKNEYKKEKEANICALLGINENFYPYPKYEIKWLNNTTLEIKYENIGSYTIYYENNEWQEEIVNEQQQ
jgi:hypothetical protein